MNGDCDSGSIYNYNGAFSIYCSNDTNNLQTYKLFEKAI